MTDRSPSSPNTQPLAGSTYEVPVEGSLALLALGARGIEAWRAKRAEVARQQEAAPPTSDAKPTDEDG